MKVIAWLIALALAASALIGCGNNARPPAPPRRLHVIVAPVVRGEVVRLVEAVAEARPARMPGLRYTR